MLFCSRITPILSSSPTWAGCLASKWSAMQPHPPTHPPNPSSPCPILVTLPNTASFQMSDPKLHVDSAVFRNSWETWPPLLHTWILSSLCADLHTPTPWKNEYCQNCPTNLEPPKSSPTDHWSIKKIKLTPVPCLQQSLIFWGVLRGNTALSGKICETARRSWVLQSCVPTNYYIHTKEWTQITQNITRTQCNDKLNLLPKICFFCR